MEQPSNDDTPTYEKLKDKVKWTVTFAPSDCPSDDVVSYVTERDSSITPRTQGGSVTFIQTRTDSYNKIDTIAKCNIRLLPPAGPYLLKVQFDDGPHDVASFFRKLTNLVRLPIGATSNALLTVVRLLDTGAGRT